MNSKVRVCLIVILAVLIACQPVIAIGWREIVFVLFLLAFVFGPPVYRLLRRLEEFRKPKDK